MREPLIGVTRGAVLRPTYRQALEVVAANVVEIGPETERGRAVHTDPRRALQGLDGLLLTGGGDLDPGLYGATSRHPTVSVDPERDAMELPLIRAALAADLPLLGICRGIQSLNVALGGSLWQDLPSERPGMVVHREAGEDRDRTKMLHSVVVQRDNLLAASAGPGSLRVNSIHHQAIRDVAAGVAVLATAADGVVEAVQVTGRRFALAVQWHPEDLWEWEVRHAAVFAAFAQAAGRRP